MIFKENALWHSFCVLAFLILFSAAAFAQNIESAKEAFERKDYQSAFNQLGPLAIAGDAEAQNYLGKLYSITDPANYAEAYKWFKKSADQGNMAGQFSIGWLYNDGNGVDKDLSEAFKWFKLAADQGYPFAQGMISTMYYNGQGTTKDKIESYKWMLLKRRAYSTKPFAQQAGVKGADIVLKEYESEMTAEEIKEAIQRADAWRMKDTSDGKSGTSSPP